MQFTQTLIYTATRRVGIMGGTFNPVHCGHICMAELALEEFGLSQVLFIPTGTPPHKPQEEVIAGVHRLRMLERALEENPFFAVSDIELRREGTTYTVDTLRELHRMYTPGTEFLFLVGSDTLFQIPHWKAYQTVLSLCSFVVFLRRGVDQRQVQDTIDMLRMQGAQIALSRQQCPEVSSSAIRQMCAQGFSLHGLVPPGVEAYIAAHGLYRGRI